MLIAVVEVVGALEQAREAVVAAERARPVPRVEGVAQPGGAKQV